MEWKGLKLTSLYEDSSWNNLQMKEYVMKGLLTVTSVTMILLTFKKKITNMKTFFHSTNNKCIIHLNLKKYIYMNNQLLRNSHTNT